MSNTEQTKKDIDIWTSDVKRTERIVLLQQLASEAGIIKEFIQIPQLHMMNIDYDKYMIHVYAMAKIRELRRIGGKSQ